MKMCKGIENLLLKKEFGEIQQNKKADWLYLE